MQSIKCSKVNSLLQITFLVIASLLTSHAVCGQASNTPVSKNHILAGLRAAKEQLPNKRKEAVEVIIDEVKKNKVDFELTSQVEEELKREGATQELLKAIRENYRLVGQPQSTEAACREQAQIRLFPATKEQALADKVLNLKDKLVDDLHYKDVEGPWSNDNPNDNPPVTVIRWFHKEDKKCAEQLKRQLKAMSPSIAADVVEGKNPGDPPPLHTIHIYVK